MTEAERALLDDVKSLSIRLTRAEMALERARRCLTHPNCTATFAGAIAEIDRALASEPRSERAA